MAARPRVVAAATGAALLLVACLAAAALISSEGEAPAEMINEKRWDRELDSATERYLNHIASEAVKTKKAAVKPRIVHNSESLAQKSHPRNEEEEAPMSFDNSRRMLDRQETTKQALGSFEDKLWNEVHPHHARTAQPPYAQARSNNADHHTQMMASPLTRKARIDAVKSRMQAMKMGREIAQELAKKSSDKDAAKATLKNATPKRSSKSKKNAHMPYVPPLSTALVARKLGLAIDRHERCRKKLSTAEMHLNTAEQKAKVAMASARNADAGLAHAQGMVKNADKLVEQARELHENYVQEVSDSLDVRSRYTTAALQAHTLLEHLSRLKKRYDHATQALAHEQVKYDKLMRKLDGEEDMVAHAQNLADDDFAQLTLGKNQDATQALAEEAPSHDSHPRREHAPSESTDTDADTNEDRLSAAHRDAKRNESPAMAASDDEVNKLLRKDEALKRTHLQPLREKAERLQARAQDLMSQLPHLQEEEDETKHTEQLDRELIKEARNDRRMVRRRLREGNNNKNEAEHLSMLERMDTRKVHDLTSELAKAEEKAATLRKKEQSGPELQREESMAKSALTAARRNEEFAEIGAGRSATAGLAWALGNLIGSQAARTVGTKLFGAAPIERESTAELKADRTKETMLASKAKNAVNSDESAARNVRQEMEVKRDIANQARKEYMRARNRWELARRRVRPLEAALHDRARDIDETRANAEKAVQKAQQHLIATRRTARLAAIAKRDADRRLRRARKLLYDKQEVVKNFARCQSAAWDSIQSLTNNARRYRIIGDGESGVDYTAKKDLASIQPE